MRGSVVRGSVGELGRVRGRWDGVFGGGVVLQGRFGPVGAVGDGGIGEWSAVFFCWCWCWSVMAGGAAVMRWGGGGVIVSALRCW